MLIHWTAALVECAVNMFVYIPAEPKMAFAQPATMDVLTYWYGANVLRRNCFWQFLFCHACVTCRYDSMACATQNSGFCW